MGQRLLDSAKVNETYSVASETLLTSEINISTITVLDNNILYKILRKYKS